MVDPSGLVRWGALGSATLGLTTNSLGIVTSVLLAAVPEPTMLTKVAGGALALKSGYGLGANAQNFYEALVDKAAVSKGALANDVAQLIAPGNENAQRAATAIDLTSDLLIGRISMTAAEDAVGTLVRDANGFPLYEMRYGYIQDPGEFGGVAAKLFTAAAAAEAGYDGAFDPLYQQFFGKKDCP
jgi:hypothetical protein